MNTDTRKVNVVEDVDGNEIVVISDVMFKGKKYDVVDIKKETSNLLQR